MRIGRLLCILALAGVICIIILIFTRQILSALILMTILVSLFVIYKTNQYVYLSLYPPHEMSFFDRNFDCLIIGDIEGMSEIVPPNKSVLRFEFPNRTLYASYIILQHVFSWLDECNGEVIILVNSENIKKQTISEYDIPLLHLITKKKFSLKMQCTKFPLIKNPILSIRYLLNHKLPIHYRKVDVPYQDLIFFCKKRNIKLTIMAS